MPKRGLSINIPVGYFSGALDNNLILLPLGLYYNQELSRARLGSRVGLTHGWRKATRYIIRRCKVSATTAVFGFMLTHLYGSDMTRERFYEIWLSDAVREGYGRNDMSTDEYLLLELKDIDKT
ncbi:MAG: hypothetical protein HDS14_00440 [Bacteroides sp.]|nr:hypothetical protein [Bacteroides sp.]